MQAEFGIAREQEYKLYHNEYKNKGSKESGKFHFHSQIELYIVKKGEVEAFINDKWTVLKEGEMSVSLSYDAHCYRTPEDSETALLIIPTLMCEDFVFATKDKRVSDPFIRDKNVVDKILNVFNEVGRSKDNAIKQKGYVYVILGMIMENIGFENAKRVIDTNLSSSILFYINENYKNDISLDMIAAEFGYNPSYVSRYFKNCFNISILQYLTLIRLKNVVMLMSERKHSITYCALESGFNSMRSFYRAFSNEFHCSPKEYIKSLENK